MESIQTKKFMENTLSLRQMIPLETETITALNLLILMMRGRSEKYPSRDLWSRAVNHAYASRLVTGLSGYGNQVLIDSRIKYLRPEYIDDPHYMDEVIDLADQALYHPVLNEENLQEAKYLLKNRLLSNLENPDALAVQEALRIAQPGHSVGIPVGGILKDVDDVTLDQIKALWQTIQSQPWSVYTVGELDEKMQAFVDSLPQSDEMVLDMELLSAHEPAYTSVEKDLSQSSLAQVYSTGIRPGTDESYALLLMNAVLGASPMSLLFEEVREKHSYCYSISSSLIRYDGAVLILTGTSRENLDHVKKLIQEQIDRIARRDFPQEKLESARLALIDGVISQQDFDLAMINQHFVNNLLNRHLSSQDLIDKVNAITIDQVAQAAGAMHLIAESTVLESGRSMPGESQEVSEEIPDLTGGLQ